MNEKYRSPVSSLEEDWRNAFFRCEDGENTILVISGIIGNKECVLLNGEQASKKTKYGKITTHELSSGSVNYKIKSISKGIGSVCEFYKNEQLLKATECQVKVNTKLLVFLALFFIVGSFGLGAMKIYLELPDSIDYFVYSVIVLSIIASVRYIFFKNEKIYSDTA